MIRFENIGLRYGIGPEVLSDINFTLEPGSFHFLTGPSGAGKTSLMRLLYMGIQPTRGIQTMFDKKVGLLDRKEKNELRQQVGVVFQDFRLMQHLSAFDNIALPLRIQNVPEKKIQENVRELMDWVGLTATMKSLPATLSGGQQQRIAIARAVIARPRLLLADEPTGNLDDSLGLKLLNLFEQLNKMGTTLVIATHDHHLIDKFGHPRMILESGRLQIEQGWLSPLKEKLGSVLPKKEERSVL